MRWRARTNVQLHLTADPQPTIVFAMPSIVSHSTEPLFQELGVFLLAVILGSLCGLATNQLLQHWVTAAVAGNAALAIATTCTGAAHSHFVHRQSWVRLLPKVGVGALLAYGAMRLVHLVLGS